MENRVYTVKFCRTCSWIKSNGKRYIKEFNRKQEGPFTLRFKSMEELVKFMVQNRISIHPVDGINHYMTPEEFKIFNKKFRAYWGTVYHK